MIEDEGFDASLAARFSQEHRQVPGDAFVADTMRSIRRARSRRDLLRIGLRVAGLAALVAASPWLIEASGWLNAAVESTLAESEGMPRGWILAVLAIAVVAIPHLRRR